MEKFLCVEQSKASAGLISRLSQLLLQQLNPCKPKHGLTNVSSTQVVKKEYCVSLVCFW